MNIKILHNSERRCAWTDRKNGYIELAFGDEAKKSGYYRGQKRYFKGFFLDDKKFFEADSIEVKPECGKIAFGEDEIEFSLLLDEEAFFVKKCKKFGLIKPRGNDKNHGKSWHKKSENGVTVLSSSTGVAIAAPFDFSHKVKNGDLSVWCDGLCAGGNSQDVGFYIAFEDDEKLAIEKAIRLLKNDAITAHAKKIQDFFEKCKVDFGDEKFNKSFQWSRFSSWLLCTKSEDSNYKGIWAGLPWFRDNWGRDTFIAFSGTLLVSGCFDEAKNVLLGFAQFQDRNPASKTYGRIPNRYRNAEDVLYNTADGTLWFLRAVAEYVEYSGDESIANKLAYTINIALEGDVNRCDERGFLTHDEADTWMDARIKGKEAWSPRANRASDIQALWFVALRLGSYFMRLCGNKEKEQFYDDFATKVKASFNEYFWSSDNNALADHLLEGGYGEWAKDMRVRPNQLFAISVPRILPESSEADKNKLIDDEKAFAILENVERELVSPFGLYSLSPEDPLFHADHILSLTDKPNFYHKDAAYHNGTIWEWNSGPYITAKTLYSNGTLPKDAETILKNESKMILEIGCAGSLSENIHARPRPDGSPVLSGTFSQAWSLAEFSRNIVQDVIGFYPRLAEGKIDIRPHLPKNCKSVKATLPFGYGKIDVEIQSFSEEKTNESDCHCENGYSVELFWKSDAQHDALIVNGETLEANKKCHFTVISTVVEKSNQKLPIDLSAFRYASLLNDRSDVVTSGQSARCPSTVISTVVEKSARNLDNEFVASQRQKNYLKRLILSGRMKSKTSGGENTASLEWFFDSHGFIKKYVTDIPLGSLYTKQKTTFRLWAPTAKAAWVLLYEKTCHCENSSPATQEPAPSIVEGKQSQKLPIDLSAFRYTSLLNDRSVEGTLASSVKMTQTSNGVWETTVDGDLHGVYYEFGVLVHGVYNHCADPYAHACGVNGKLSMVCDMERTNPAGWENVTAPKVKSRCDVIVYEADVADLTSSPYWNGKDEKKRTYAGVTESGTSYDGAKTGFDHIKSLGVTHLQLLPIFDFSSVNETKPRGSQYNWGYDPENYGCPEGSYSADPYNGEVRIKEVKQLVKDCAENGIGVVMDVVFNHVNNGLHQPLGVFVPGYFFRVEGYSGAGEDTASERAMFSRYMVDMLSFWLKEYKLSGFRFDLMGLHDVDTMNKIADALQKIKSDVLIYGEGWDMYRAGKMTSASMVNAKKMPFVGHFNDAVRCAIKGSVFSDTSKGFVHDGSSRESVKFGIVGSTRHNQVDNSKVSGTANPHPWSKKTWTSVNYTEIHDNMTLNDKLHLTEEGHPEEYYEQLEKMAISLVLLSEGMPILHAGMEFGRTKKIPDDLVSEKDRFNDVASSFDGKSFYLRNSYNAPDAINALDWKRCAEKQNLVDYVRSLINLRKTHPAFRMEDASDVQKCLHFLDNEKFGFPPEVLGWMLDGKKCGDTWKKIIIFANPLTYDIRVKLPNADEMWLLSGRGNNHKKIASFEVQESKLAMTHSWKIATDGTKFLNGEEVKDAEATIPPKTVWVGYV